MSYSIETRSLIEFINDENIKLPRFQRRGVWKEKQKFELAISIFQNYPVGVIILNKTKNESWLLDGRQRRTALKEIHDNPVLLYKYAKTYIGFRPNDDALEVKNKFWKEIEIYLQKDEQDENLEDENPSNYGGFEDPKSESSFYLDQQKEGLKTLLNIILFVHTTKNKASQFERAFDFTKYFKLLPYAPKKEANKVNPSLLRNFLLQFYNTHNKDNFTEEDFCNYYYENYDYGITNEDKLKFENQINNTWDYIYNTILTINKAEKVFKDARIGTILLSNVSPLDSQNIFSRINKGGTQLKAEELLSAKPFWNQPVTISDPQTKNLIESMYEKLEVDELSKIVRWDLAATILMRIKDKNLLFGDYIDPKDPNNISIEQISLGFKLLSSYYVGGMSANSVSELESKNINWESDIDTFVNNINIVCQLLLDNPFFDRYIKWQKPIGKLLGNAIVLEFIIICLKNWEKKGMPANHNSGTYKAVQRDAIILFDRLIFEYSSKMWRGSGDSKMSQDIQNWENRITPISEEQWIDFIKQISEGTLNGVQVNQKTVTPVLYYYYLLKNFVPNYYQDEQYDVDHIIPQDKFKDNLMIKDINKDCLTNLCILPKRKNISKSNKPLKDITDDWLKQEISKYSDISEDDFIKYSDVSNFEELKESRYAQYKSVFSKNRISLLSN